jgi:hypothetical protein
VWLGDCAGNGVGAEFAETMWLRNTVKQRHHQRSGGREVFGFGRGNRSGSGDEANKDEVFAAAGGGHVAYFPPIGRGVVVA